MMVPAGDNWEPDEVFVRYVRSALEKDTGFRATGGCFSSGEGRLVAIRRSSSVFWAAVQAEPAAAEEVVDSGPGGPSFAYSLPHAPSPHAQGSSGVVATMLFVWRGHTEEPHHSGRVEP